MKLCHLFCGVFDVLDVCSSNKTHFKVTVAVGVPVVVPKSPQHLCVSTVSSHLYLAAVLAQQTITETCLKH